MKRNGTIIGLGLTFLLGAAGVAAQAPQGERPRQGVEDQRGHGRHGEARGERRGMRRGGPGQALLKGITLTDAQKKQLADLRTSERERMQSMRESSRESMQQMREARQKGDTARANTQMRALRQQMDAQRDRHIAAVRGILTAEQRTRFDANVAEWKARAAEGRGFGDRRGFRRGRDGRDGRERGDSASKLKAPRAS